MDLLWFDAETSGLEAGKCVILEVALSRATLLDPFNAVPVYDSVVQLLKAQRDRLEIDPYVVDMHTKNGLWEECDSTDVPSIRHVENELLMLVDAAATKDDMPVLAGSSVHFDHGFLLVHMPRLAARLSHRHYDVSAIKLFCQSQGMPKFRKVEAHRARPDVEESIQHGRECKQWLKTYLSGIDDGR